MGGWPAMSRNVKADTSVPLRNMINLMGYVRILPFCNKKASAPSQSQNRTRRAHLSKHDKGENQEQRAQYRQELQRRASVVGYHVRANEGAPR